MANQTDVPEVVVERLPQYLRALAHLKESGIEVISSQQLGELLQVTPAQIRKDLSYFGRFARLLLMALAMASMASSWPTTRLWSSSSM